MERTYGEKLNMIMNALYDSLQRMGIEDYSVRKEEGTIAFGCATLRLVPLGNRTTIRCEGNDGLCEALLDEIGISLRRDGGYWDIINKEKRSAI